MDPLGRTGPPRLYLLEPSGEDLSAKRKKVHKLRGRNPRLLA